MSTTLIDLGQDVGARAAARRIADLGCPPPGHHELGADAAGWWTTELTALPNPGRGAGGGVLDALREPGAVVLASGGTTGIVAYMLCAEAERLSGPLPGCLVLLSRTPAAADGAGSATRRQHSSRGAAITRGTRCTSSSATGPGRRAPSRRRPRSAGSKAGIRVEHQVLDVCDTRATRALGEQLRLKNMTVRTIVHGAGVERSSRITDKPAQEWAATAAVKIVGFHALVDAATGDDPTALRLVVTHGSLSGSLGLPGQTDYAAGNEYLAMARTPASRAPGTCRPSTSGGPPGMTSGWPLSLRPSGALRAWACATSARRRAPGGSGDRQPCGHAPVPDHRPARPAATVSDREDLGLAGAAERWAAGGHRHRAQWEAIVRRLYDSADPRDSELGDHRVGTGRGSRRSRSSSISPRRSGPGSRMRPGSNCATSCCTRAWCVHERTSARHGHRAGWRRRPGHAGNETAPLLAGDLPGPGTVLSATAAPLPSTAGSPGGRSTSASPFRSATRRMPWSWPGSSDHLRRPVRVPGNRAAAPHYDAAAEFDTGAPRTATAGPSSTPPPWISRYAPSAPRHRPVPARRGCHRRSSVSRSLYRPRPKQGTTHAGPS